MSRTEICLVIDHLGLGGAQQSATNFVRRADQKRFAMSICSLGPVSEIVKPLADGGINVATANASRWNPFLLDRVTHIAADLGARMLYLRLNKALFIGSIVAQRMKIPFVYHGASDQSAIDLENIFPTKMGARLMLRYKRFCVRRAAATITCAPPAAEDLLNLGMVQRERLHIVPNGVELERFQYAPAERQDARMRVRGAFGIPDDAVVLINAGRFAEEKNWPAFLRAVLAARRVQSSEYALAVGDGHLFAHIRALAHQLGLHDVVCFPGYRDDIPDLMTGSDVLLFPSLREGDSNTVKEAMACGLPVVGFSAGGTGLAVRCGEHGYVVPVNDEAAMQARLCQLVTNRDLRCRLATSARDRAFAEFGIDRTVRHIERVLTQVDEQRWRGEDPR